MKTLGTAARSIAKHERVCRDDKSFICQLSRRTRRIFSTSPIAIHLFQRSDFLSARISDKPNPGRASAVVHLESPISPAVSSTPLYAPLTFQIQIVIGPPRSSRTNLKRLCIVFSCEHSHSPRPWYRVALAHARSRSVLRPDQVSPRS